MSPRVIRTLICVTVCLPMEMVPNYYPTPPPPHPTSLPKSHITAHFIATHFYLLFPVLTTCYFRFQLCPSGPVNVRSPDTTSWHGKIPDVLWNSVADVPDRMSSILFLPAPRSQVRQLDCFHDTWKLPQFKHTRLVLWFAYLVRTFWSVQYISPSHLIYFLQSSCFQLVSWNV